MRNLSVVSQLKFIVQYYNLDVLFLSETLVHTNKIEEFHYLLGFDFCFSLDIVSRGGIALFWRKTLNCSIVYCSSNHISARIEEEIMVLGYSHAFMGIQKLVEEEIHGTLLELMN